MCNKFSQKLLINIKVTLIVNCKDIFKEKNNN